MLTKESVQSVQDQTIVKVDIPEWKDHLFVRTMSGKEQDDYAFLINSSRDAKGELDIRGMRARLIVLTACDDKGNLLFSPEDMKWLMEKSSAALTRVFNATAKLNGFDEKAIEEAEGNLKGTPTEEHGSVLPVS